MKKRSGHIILMIAMLMLGSSCSTEKATWSHVAYHNTTCHYNVWWNGNESLKAGLEKLRQLSPDDYTLLLPVENLGTADATRTAYPDFDRALEKGVKGIKKHSIFVGGEEHVNYVRECYLLTAYATFYKQDYAATANTASILVSQFAGTRAADEGAVLMARCMTREKRYSEAETTLDQLVGRLSEGEFDKSLREQLYLAMVESTVPQQKYKKAVEYIHLALECTHSRRIKARLNFLLAQIYQELHRPAIASKYYYRVLSYGPEYVMEFNARLGEASCADLEHTDVARLEQQLDKMLSDRKNYDYRDQILYAKGMMYLGVKDARKACDNLRRSVAVATVNRAQKAKSAIQLGSILYEIYEDYEGAEPYYDTAMQCITPDYPNYRAIRRRAEVLRELCGYTRAFHHADSLIAVAAMPESERNALIKAKIDTLIAQEKREAEQALIDEANASRRAGQNMLKGDWYFYNSNTVQKGRDSFRKQWGDRPLEDNWFISQKISFQMASADEDSAMDEDGTAADATATGRTAAQSVADNPNDPHSPAYYLKELPTTQHQLDSLDTLIARSLLNAAYLYYDGVHNLPLALQCYHRLATDYTGYSEAVQTFYMLYRIYDRQGNTPQSNYYRDMVLMGFPDSDFAGLIRDNEYYKELLRRGQVVETAYQDLYTDFQEGHYSDVIAQASQADDLYEGHPMLKKFHYWKGLAQAAQGERTEAITTLEAIKGGLARNDTLYMLVEKQLQYLRSDSAQREQTRMRRAAARGERRVNAATATATPAGEEIAADVQLPPESQVYRYRDGQAYYVIVLINDRTIKATELQYRLTDFNTAYYVHASYRVNATLFNDSTQMLTVHQFKNAEAAMGYYRHLAQDESPLLRYSDEDYTVFAISTQNYATFYSRKNIAAYAAFFEKYLLNKQ